MTDFDKLKESCQRALEKAAELVPFSSNTNPKIPNRKKAHRLLWMKAMRARNDRDGNLKKLKSYRLNLRPEVCETNYLNKRLRIGFFDNKNPSVYQWVQFINTLPRRSKRECRKNGAPITFFEKMENMAKAAVRMGIGNCHELSALSLVLLAEQNFSLNETITIEFAYLSGDDHRFLIINRKKNSCLQDMTSWGPDALVLDTWMREVFCVSEEIIKPKSSFNSFNYIFNRQLKITREEEEVSYIGQSHSINWVEKRIERNESLFLHEWEPIEHSEATENLPWLDDKDEDDTMHKRRRCE